MDNYLELLTDQVIWVNKISNRKIEIISRLETTEFNNLNYTLELRDKEKILICFSLILKNKELEKDDINNCAKALIRELLIIGIKDGIKITKSRER